MSNTESKNEFLDTVKTVWEKICFVTEKICNVFRIIWSFLYRMRKIVMAVPVMLAAAWLAQYNNNALPELVGINLQSTGEYAQMISQDLAILGPIAVTAACLLLMFCSRRTLYPWLISVFSLVLPVLLLLTNMFPA